MVVVKSGVYSNYAEGGELGWNCGNSIRIDTKVDGENKKEVNSTEH